MSIDAVFSIASDWLLSGILVAAVLSIDTVRCCDELSLGKRWAFKIRLCIDDMLVESGSSRNDLSELRNDLPLPTLALSPAMSYKNNDNMSLLSNFTLTA